MPFVRLMGVVPLGVGLTVLGFLWGAPFGEFGSPPLFFRMFGSFVALAFVLQGLALLSGSLTSPQRLKQVLEQFKTLRDETRLPLERDPPGSALGYQCASCGAPLDSSADVSPHGDVKCSHCGKWFNIHSPQGS